MSYLKNEINFDEEVGMGTFSSKLHKAIYTRIDSKKYLIIEYTFPGQQNIC